MTPDETFPKNERLVKTGDFKKVYEKGVSIRKGALILYSLPNVFKKNRIGFSLSSRRIRLAARRAKVKRRLREAYRKNKHMLKKGFDIVIVVRQDVTRSFSYKDIERSFINLSKEAGLLLLG